MLVTLWALPATWTIALLGFVVFRVLDVVKPWPARRLEGLHGGLGMMADDVMAAVYANLLLRGLLWAVPALAV
jgi:phosphatidylglycerophosphatase A